MTIDGVDYDVPGAPIRARLLPSVLGLLSARAARYVPERTGRAANRVLLQETAQHFGFRDSYDSRLAPERLPIAVLVAVELALLDEAKALDVAEQQIERDDWLVECARRRLADERRAKRPGVIVTFGDEDP